MSSAVGTSSYSTLGLMLASASSLRDRLATLQEQTTTGLVSQSYSGLASVSSQVLDLTAATSQNNAYAQVMTQAQGKASVMQAALSQIGTMVSSMATSALGNSGTTTPSAVTTMAQQAGQALTQLVAALNTTYGGDYVFAGADTSNAPVPSPSTVTSSGMYTNIANEVSALATTPTTPSVTTVIANTVLSASPTAVGNIFSTYLTGAGLSAAPVTVQVGPSDSITLDLPATKNVGAVSDPSIHGTGNAISDIMRSLAVMASSTGGMATNPDFQTLMQNAATTLTSAGATLTQESAQIGLSQNAMTTAAASNSSMQTIMATQFSGLTQVDIATAVSTMQTVNTQLQASYKVLGEVSSLNLASYL
jgi:flagellar hook-associated protein 3 FlgL